MHSSRTNKWHRSIAIRLPPSVPQLKPTQHNSQLVLLDKKKELNSTHRFLLISSRLMPAGGSTQSSQIRSCTSVRWHPAQWAAGGSKASAMVAVVLLNLSVERGLKRTAKLWSPLKKRECGPSMPCRSLTTTDRTTRRRAHNEYNESGAVER